MSAKDISVIVPTFNHEAMICLAMESIVRQTVFHDCHVVVSDDCSSDNTFDLAQAFAKYHDNIVVRRNPRKLGVMNHYKILLSEVTTTFLAGLEGDDMCISENKLEVQRRFLEHNPSVGMCFSACVVEYEATASQVSHPAWNDGRNRIIGILDLFYDNPVATFSNCFYRSPILNNALLSADSGTGYDWLCTLKIANVSQVGFLVEPSTLYRVHRNGTWSGMSRYQQRRAIRRSLRAFLRLNSSMRAFVHDAMRDV